MMIQSKNLWRIVFVVVLATIWQISTAEDDHDDHDDHEGEEEALILTEEEKSAAGIKVSTVAAQPLAQQLRLPGEVIPNAYKSAKVAPRIEAQVMERHAQLGDQIETGQRLVTLSSVEMAEAQGELLVADQEWRRVRAIGKDVVSARRFAEAQIGRQQAMAKVLAYGMTKSQANRMLEAQDPEKATGAFDLLAPLAGTVLMDDFVIGELLEPGHVVFEISDESTLWIEARTSANQMSAVTIGTDVRVSNDGGHWQDAKVTQIHHRIDEATRTQAVRIEVDNEGDLLHPGQFVEVELAGSGVGERLAVPTEAVVLMKGDSVVFLLEDGDEFHPKPITVGTTYGKWTEVIGGLEEGDTIAVAGTFFLKSLVLKSEMGEGHVH